MNELHELLSRRWVVRAKDKDLYYKLKDASGDLRKFLNEKLGYQMMITPNVIKVVKLPGYAEPWMGIDAFDDVMEYRIFCWILMYLEDKEPDEQFLLSQVCEFIQMQASSDVLDWTRLKQRKQLVNVIRYCHEQSILAINDGDEENFSRTKDSEVLFENLGTSKYFMRVFTQDIMKFEQPSDFAKSDWIDSDETRGIVRRNRVYRRLAMSMGLYKSDQEDSDFDYIKNQRTLIENDFQQYFDCHLDVHRSSAYLIVSKEDVLGKSFPANNSESDIMLLWNNWIQQQVEQKHISVDANECIHMSTLQLQGSIEKIKQEHADNLAKKYKEATTQTFVDEIMKSLVTFGWISREEERGYIIHPIVGKIKAIMVNKQEG